jgi:hypothetical protein
MAAASSSPRYRFRVKSAATCIQQYTWASTRIAGVTIRTEVIAGLSPVRRSIEAP